MVQVRSLLYLAALVPFAGIGNAAEPAPAYNVVAHISLGAPDRWDSVVFDAPSNRVYVAHGTDVSVVDAQTLKPIGAVSSVAGGTHGVAVAPGGEGFTDDGIAGVAVPFDTTTFKPGTPLPAAPDADGIVYDQASGEIFVINGDSGSITAIDPKSNTVKTTIDGGAGLEFGVADSKGTLYVNGAEKAELLAIDTATHRIKARWPATGCVKPHGIALDEANARVFVTCVNQAMLVFDASSGAVVATLPIGSCSDGAAFDPTRKLAFSSNGDGTLSVIEEKDADTFVALEPIKTAPSARTMAIDPKTGRLFLAAARIAEVDPPSEPGGRPHVTYVPGSLELLVLQPAS